MGGPVAIKIPIDTSGLKDAKSQLLEIRKELKEANRDIVQTKKSGGTVSGAQIARAQIADSNLYDFKEQMQEKRERAKAVQQSRTFQMHQAWSQEKFDQDFAMDMAQSDFNKRAANERGVKRHNEQVRTQKWNDAFSQGKKARAAAWDSAIESGEQAREDAEYGGLGKYLGSSKSWGKWGRARGFGDLQSTVMALRTAHHVASRFANAANAFGISSQMTQYGENPNALKTNSEYAGDRLSAAGQLALLIPHPIAKIGGAIAIGIGEAASLYGAHDRNVRDNARDIRLFNQQFLDGRLQRPGDRAWAGFGGDVKPADVLAKAKDEIKKENLFYRVTDSKIATGIAASIAAGATLITGGWGGYAFKKYAQYKNEAYQGEVNSKAAEMLSSASTAKDQGYMYLESQDFGKAREYFNKAESIVKGSAPTAWNMSDLYMAKLGSEESHKTYARGQMKRAGNRTGD